MPRKQYMIKGQKVSKKEYIERMRAIHSRDHSKKGSGKKRFRNAQRVNSQRPEHHRQIDYNMTNKETIDVSNDNIDEYSVHAYGSWQENQGAADIVGIDTPEYKREQKAIEHNFEKDKEKQLSPKTKTTFGTSTLGKEIMSKNRQHYRNFLDQIGAEELPKGSKLGFLEIASLQRKIEDSSHDYKSDSIYDDFDLKLELSENVEILERKYPQTDFKDMKSQELAYKRDRNEEFLEEHYLSKAEKNPTKAIEDTMHDDKPVRKIPSENINKKWLDNPFNKSSGDYKGIDDTTEPYSRADFSESAFQEESLREFKKKGKPKKSQKEIKLLKEAKLMLDSADSGYLEPRQKSILKGAIKDAETKKDYSDLKEYFPKYKVKLRKQKKQIQDKNKAEEKREKEFRKTVYKGKSKNQLIRSLVSKLVNQEEENKKFSELKTRNPAERTQRKAKLNNKLDAQAREILQLQEAIKEFSDKNKFTRYKQVTNRLSVINDRIQFIEQGIPPRSSYEQRQPFIKKARPLLKERDILLLEQVNLEKPYLKADKKGKVRFDYPTFAEENK